MDDFETLEADFPAPFFKIGGGIMEKKIDSLRFIESRIRRGECQLARKKCAEFAANHLDGAINSRQLLSIDFLRSVFFRMKHLALILSIPLLLVTYARAAPVVFIVR